MKKGRQLLADGIRRVLGAPGACRFHAGPRRHLALVQDDSPAWCSPKQKPPVGGLSNSICLSGADKCWLCLSTQRSSNSKAEHRRMGLIGPAAPSSRVPTQSWPANHPDRWSDHDRSDHDRHRLNYDPPIEVATTIRSTMRAPAATFSGLNTDACKAEQRGEDRYRQDLSGHLLVYPLNLRKRRLCSIRPANMLIPR